MSLLEDMRLSHQWTQREIARRINVSHMTYRRYEYGEEFPKKDALKALAKLYGMSPGELFNQLIGWGNEANEPKSIKGKNDYQQIKKVHNGRNTMPEEINQTNSEVLDNFLMHYNLLLRRYARFKEINQAQNTDISVLTFLDIIVVQLRAMCIESKNIEEKNYTAQRLLRMEGRDDLAQEIEKMLEEPFAEIIGMTTRDALKYFADKYICHYDAFCRRDINLARIIEQNLRNPYGMVNLAHIMYIVTGCINEGLGLPDRYGKNLEKEYPVCSIDF